MADASPEKSIARWQRRMAIVAGALAVSVAAGACGSSQDDFFSSEDGGQCNQGSAQCSACGPCPDGRLCIEGECVVAVCRPGSRVCAGTSVVTCSADGNGYGEPQACSGGCVAGPDGAECADGPDGSAGSGGGGSGGAGGSGGGGSGGGGSGGSGGSGGIAGSGGSSGSSGAGGSGSPDAVLLIDRSTSAEALLPDGVRTRWSMIQNDVVSAVRSAEQRALRVSLGVYGYTGLADQCPAVDGLMPAGNNFAQVANHVAALTMPEDKSETPTGAAIARVTQLIGGRNGRRTVILITDGIPDTCDKPDQACWDAAVYALQASYRAGVTTRIIGVGPDVSQELLQDLANAGSGQPVQAPPPTRSVCGPGVPTYAPNGGSARFDHVIDSGLDQALLAALTAASG
jgi:hypothetical protein